MLVFPDGFDPGSLLKYSYILFIKPIYDPQQAGEREERV